MRNIVILNSLHFSYPLPILMRVSYNTLIVKQNTSDYYKYRYKFCSITEKADSIPSFSLFSNIFLMFLFDIQKYCSIFVEVCDEK